MSLLRTPAANAQTSIHFAFIAISNQEMHLNALSKFKFYKEIPFFSKKNFYFTIVAMEPTMW